MITLYRIDNLIETLDKIRKEQGHNMIAAESEIEFSTGYTDGESYLSEYDFIEVPDTEKEKYKPVHYIGKPKEWTYG